MTRQQYVMDIGGVRAARLQQKSDEHSDPNHPKVSKWSNARSSNLVVHEALHLTGIPTDYDVTENIVGKNNPVTKNSKEVLGTAGIYAEASFDYLKLLAAEIKHNQNNPNTANVDKNFLVLPSWFCYAAEKGNIDVMDEIYRQYAHYGRRPDEYRKIIINGGMRHGKLEHGLLVVIWFQGNDIKIITYDSTDFGVPNKYPTELGAIKRWLQEKYSYKRPIVLEESLIQPEQRDSWNCAYYVMRYAEQIMLGKKPSKKNLKDLDLPQNEPMCDQYKKSKKYERGRKVNGQLFHPELDKLIGQINTERTQMKATLMTTFTQPMSGFVQNWYAPVPSKPLNYTIISTDSSQFDLSSSSAASPIEPPKPRLQRTKNTPRRSREWKRMNSRRTR
jgi:hypothetical protein